MPTPERMGQEEALRELVLAGDERAWRALYEASFAGLHAYALWRCGGWRETAEEITQETWLTAVRRMADFDPARGTFAAWLRGIAANLLRNRFRRDSRRSFPPLSPVKGQADPADAELEQQERAVRVARALAELPERYEAILRARYLEDLPLAQIAAQWNESPKALESLLTRARQAFRAAYGEPEEMP
jgi:RNA polymerase sigma-70 factor (ECF subfamily)